MRRAKGNRKLVMGIAGVISFALIGSGLVMPDAWAARSGSGGGDKPKVDGGKIAMNVGISIGASVVGGMLSSAASGAGDMAKGTGTLATTGANMGGSIANSLSVPGLMSGFGAYVAGTQAARAVGAAGNYYGWSNSTIFLASSMASGAVGGIVNPGAALGSSLSKTAADSFSAYGKAAVVGAVGGAASAGTIIAIDGDKINKGQSPGWGAQLAGMGAGMTATSMSRAMMDSRTYTQSFEKYTKQNEIGWVSKDGNVPYSGNGISGDPKVPDNTLLSSAAQQVGSQVGQDLSIEQTARMINNPNTQVVGTSDGQTTFLIKNSGTSFTMDSRAADFFAGGGIRPAPDGSLWVASNKPSAGQVMGNIFVNPVIDTLNQWPVFAGSALSTIVTSGMDDKSKWKDFAKGVSNSFFTSTFDALATTQMLKPSLAFDIDQALGNYPAMQYARQQMMNEAVATEIAYKVDKLSQQDIDNTIYQLRSSGMNLNKNDQLNLVNNLLGDKGINLSDEAKYSIYGKLVSLNEVAEKQKINFNLKRSFYDGVMERLKTEPSANSLSVDNGLLKNSGVSTLDVFGRQLFNNIRYDLPVSALSGVITVGLKQTIDKNDPMRSSLITLAETAGTSLARGVVWYAQGQLLHDQTVDSISSGGFNPRVAAHRNLQDPVEIVIARAQGFIPPADTTTYKLVQDKNLIDQAMMNRLGVEEADGGLFRDYLTMSSGGKVSEASSEALGKIRDEVSRDLSVIGIIPSPAGGFLKVDDTTIRASSDRIYANDQKILVDSNTKVMSDKNWVLYDGKLVATEKFYINGENQEKIFVTPYDVAKAPGLFQSMAGSLGQGLHEYGLNTLSMGAPIARDGKVSSYAWYRYAYDTTNPSSLRTLTLLGSRPGGFATTMSNYYTDTGIELAGRNVMTTVPDLPGVGNFLGLSPIVPITGYKGMPFSVAIVMNDKFGGADTRFYGQWPVNVLSNVPSNPMHAAFRSGIISYTSGTNIIPENKIEDPRIKVQMLNK